MSSDDVIDLEGHTGSGLGEVAVFGVLPARLPESFELIC
jgi:hypothetical protein